MSDEGKSRCHSGTGFLRWSDLPRELEDALRSMPWLLRFLLRRWGRTMESRPELFVQAAVAIGLRRFGHVKGVM